MDKTNKLHTQERSLRLRAGRIIRALAGPGTSPAVALLIWFSAGLFGYLFAGADAFFSARPVGVAWLTALPGPAVKEMSFNILFSPG